MRYPGAPSSGSSGWPAALAWFPELECGWFPVASEAAEVYGRDYWNKYRGYDATPVGTQLTSDRVRFARSRCQSAALVDVGIGGGRFALEADAYGFDVNPHAIAWLQDEQRWRDPYAEPVDALTFWDSLEHIANPAPLLAQAREWVFVSLPIFRDAAHVLASKHYRRDEHFWYFTRPGFVRFMDAHGFACKAAAEFEQDAGREDIETFAFRRKK